MKTPIYDFVKKYSESGVSRFHMPGHKGRGPLGCEALDITEIFGADTLYSADGIIDESERYASRLFGTAKSFYSTEGSTLAIRAMLAAALANTRKNTARPLVLATRVLLNFSGIVQFLDFFQRLSHNSFNHRAAVAVFDFFYSLG